MARIQLTDDETTEALDIARRVAAGQLGDRAGGNVEDAAQEAIARLLTQDPPPDNWRAWLNVVAANVARDVHRREDKESPADLEEPDDVEQLRRFVAGQLPTSAAAMIGPAMDFLTEGLSERDRKMLLAANDGADNTELAEAFDLASPAVAGQTLYRIRQRLLKRLDEIGYERHHPRPY